MNRRELIASLFAMPLAGVPIATTMRITIQPVVTHDQARSIAEVLREVIANSKS